MFRAGHIRYSIGRLRRATPQETNVEAQALVYETVPRRWVQWTQEEEQPSFLTTAAAPVASVRPTGSTAVAHTLPSRSWQFGSGRFSKYIGR